VTAGNTYYVNVGAGGVNQSTVNDTTVAGGDSWFNSVNSPSSTIIAKGGAGGQSAVGNTTATAFGTGGTGTTAGSAGDVVYAGGSGATTPSVSPVYGGAGGGSGGTASAGNSGVANSGTGATAVTGGGNGGNPNAVSGSSGSGQMPTLAPGGGGGGARDGGGTLKAGGTGCVGRVVLVYKAGGGSANNAPVFTADPISKVGATEDASYTGQTLAGSATDADGDTLSYSAQGGPAWLSIATGGTLSGTPANADVGANSWSVQVSDGKGGTDTAILNITVANVNDAPVFTVDPMSRADASVGAAYSATIAGSATDVDAGATLTYSKVSGPTWLSIATSGALTGTPASGDTGANSWTVQVSDGLGGTDTAVLNITVIVPAPQTLTNTFYSVNAEDGYVLESAETSNIGGAMAATLNTTASLRVGDDATKKQYKAVVSFDTSALPDGATIISATLRIKCGAISSAPTTLGAINVDIKNGTGFGGATALAISDFEAAAGATGVATMSYPAKNYFSTGALNTTGMGLVDKTGKTQLRVYFTLDDDNDTKADYLGFYSGEAAAGNKPELVIVYQ
jgi:hypothetical protein